MRAETTERRGPRFFPGDLVDHLGPRLRLRWSHGLGGRVRQVLGLTDGDEVRWRYQVAWPVRRNHKVLIPHVWHDEDDLSPVDFDEGDRVVSEDD